MKAIIVDDEKDARQVLIALLEIHAPEIAIVAESKSMDEAVIAISTHKPDIVFLDIKMPGGSGFDLLDKLDHIGFHPIFITAHSQYALHAFRYAALDYLLKPIKPEELVMAIKRATSYEANTLIQSQFQIYREHLGSLEAERQRIALPSAKEIEIVKVMDIVHCKGEKNYTLFYLSNKEKIVASKTLRNFEEILDSRVFMRIYKSHLINLNHILKYKRGRGGSVIMSNGSELKVSRDKKTMLIEAINKRY